jgi:signal transduction histidine kinase
VTDIQAIFVMTALASVAVGLIGALVLQAIRRRSLQWSIIVAALVPVGAVTASVWVNVTKMVLSQRDTWIVTVALIFASLLAVAVSYVLGRRVASGSRELVSALRGLATTAYAADTSGVLDRRGDWSSAPAEITRLGEELEAARGSLRSSRDRERALEQSRRELVAFMSHDLRTPLAGLRALAEGLEDHVVEDEAAALRQMRQTVDRINGLVGDLFELSRLTSGQREPQSRGLVSLVELAHDVVGEAREHARQRQVELVADIADDRDHLAVQGNSDELTRALSNLVGNAVRHTRPRGRVVVTAQRGQDGRARWAVSDGCGGIDADDLRRVFDVGWRGEPERGSRDAGAGLGLAIARGVVESHAGTISVANIDGGCRFEVELPSPAGA